MIRKGQHLFNEISKRHNLENLSIIKNGQQELYPYVNLHKILFYMPDDEFENIIKSGYPLAFRNIPVRKNKTKELEEKIRSIKNYHIKKLNKTESDAEYLLHKEIVSELNELLTTVGGGNK